MRAAVKFVLIAGFVMALLFGCAAFLVSAAEGPGATVSGTLAPEQNRYDGDTTDPVESPAAGAPKGVGEGTWEVGADIKAGRYKTAGPSEDGLGICYWARLSATDGESIIVNGLPQGPSVVTIKKSDAAFETNGCAPWIRQK